MPGLFIIMPMSENKPHFDDVLDSIKYVSEKLNINAIRIDDDISNEKISDRILKCIREADYIVADLTDSRPNVFFEAGFALGINKIPVFIAENETKLEFDIKDYPIIFFRNQRELRDRLYNRLKANIKTPVQFNTEATNNVSNYDENDIINILKEWAEKEIKNNSIGTIQYNIVDAKLGLEPGSTEKYLENIVTSHWNYEVDKKGENTIRFKLLSSGFLSTPRNGFGIDLDKY